jgi:hypothetical protein
MRFHRKTAPGVRNGQVRKKHNWRREPDYTRTHQVRIERYAPRRGFRHYVSPTDIQAFLNLLPEWRDLSIGLQSVVLSSDTTCHGWCSPGTVAVCAWEDDPWRVFSVPFYEEHAATFRRLGIPCRPAISFDCLGCNEEIAVVDGVGRCEECELVFGPQDTEETGIAGYLAEFTDETVQAFLLVHVLVHELGHHHDRMTSPRQLDCTRGESYAEQYALRHEARIWEEYKRVFKVRALFRDPR